MIHKKIEMIETELIAPYEKNAKVHTQAQIKALAEMIKVFGWDQPIVVDSDLVIIKGHCRFESAKYLELKEVPVIIAKDLTESQVKAARIADNKIAETDWDTEQLISELEELKVDDLLDSTGFSDDELQRLIDGPEKKKVSFDVAEKTDWELKVSFDNEDDQQDLFIELRDRGFKVKA